MFVDGTVRTNHNISYMEQLLFKPKMFLASKHITI